MVTFNSAFAVLAATDLARAKAWYADKLGLQTAMDNDWGVVYRIGGTWVTLYESAFAGTAKSTALGLLVDDLDAAMDELRGKGVRFEDYDLPNGPKTVEGVATDESGGKAAWFTDSEGNIVNLVQQPPGFPAG